VADSFETLQAPTPLRPAFAPWSAIDEIARGVGRLFAADVVDALRRVSAVPPRGEAEVVLSVAEVASV
jgi:HD-GYP domain-containing protein (c-di-GMP phosphodiesterase class II)